MDERTDIVVAKFSNKENAEALRNYLSNNVKHLWVMVYSPTEKHPYYDISIQSAAGVRSSKDQLKECENVITEFTPPVEEEPVVEETTESKIEANQDEPVAQKTL